MNGAGAMLSKGRKMRGRTVAFVTGKAVFGIDLGIRAHHPVTRHFGDNGCRRDADALRVAADDRFLCGAGEIGNRQAVNQHVVRGGGKQKKRGSHSFAGCLQNVDPVNGFRRNNAEANRKRFAPYANFGPLPLPRGELFGIVDPRRVKVFGQHDAGRNDRASQRAAPDLIYSGNDLVPGGTRQALMPPEVDLGIGQ